MAITWIETRKRNVGRPLGEYAVRLMLYGAKDGRLALVAAFGDSLQRLAGFSEGDRLQVGHDARAGILAWRKVAAGGNVYSRIGKTGSTLVTRVTIASARGLPVTIDAATYAAGLVQVALPLGVEFRFGVEPAKGRAK